MRDLRLAALDANMNYDSEENRPAKQQRAEGLQKAYEEGLKILSAAPSQPKADDSEDDPLFNPIKRRAVQVHHEANQPLVAEAGMGRQLLEAS